MSIRYMSWVFDCSKSENSARLVALALADHADDYGRCWPGYQRIAEKTRLSLRSIGRAIAELVELGEVEIVREHYKGKQTKIYQMKQPDNLSTGQSVRKTAHTPDNLSKSPDNLSPITVINRQQDEPSKKIPPKKPAAIIPPIPLPPLPKQEQPKSDLDTILDHWYAAHNAAGLGFYKTTKEDRADISFMLKGLTVEKIKSLIDGWFAEHETNTRYHTMRITAFAKGYSRVAKSTKSSNDNFHIFSNTDKY